MSPSEKRYFDLFSQRAGKGGAKLYSQLFSAIESQVKYDEGNLKVQFSGTSFGRSLAFPKSHLYQQVLRVLQSYQYEKSTTSRYVSSLQKVELLSGRGFPNQALKVLEKGMKEVVVLDMAASVLQFLRWKRRLVLRVQEKKYPEVVKAISELEKAWEMKWLLEQRAIRLHDILYMAMQESRRQIKAHQAPELMILKEEIEEIMQAGDLTFETKVALSRARAHLAHLMDDVPAIHDAYQEEVNTWKAYPQQLKNDGMRYIRSYGAWLNSKTLVEDDANLIAEIHQLREQEGMEEREKALIFRITYSLELFYYLNSDQFEAAMGMAPAIEKGLERYVGHLSPGFKLGFFHNMAILFWLGEKPGAALQWVQSTLHFEAGEIRKDIRTFAPFLEKILYLELGYIEHLESWFRSSQYLKRKGSPQARLETMLLDLIRKLIDETDHSLIVSAYTTFLTELEVYSQLPNVSKLALVELGIWAERKIV